MKKFLFTIFIFPILLSGEEFKNSVGIEFVLIKKGKFIMGSPENERGRSENEGPQKEIEITRNFYISKYEITNSQFDRFIKETGYNGKNETDGQFLNYWKNPNAREKHQITPECPVVWVSWYSAIRFCNWLSKKEGKKPVYIFEGKKVIMAYPYDGGYRLPTEAEWEYAARAGTTTPFSFGSNPEKLKIYCGREYSSMISSGGLPIVVEVNKGEPNPWGIYNVHGNVCEWVWDWYSPNYKNIKTIDPLGPKKGKMRVVRGGSSFLQWWYRRSTSRMPVDPLTTRYDLGFRIVFNPKKIYPE
ncbi:formylglycine-generating enzyme family protein [bacterium]|nr:formylglycine-generating enzyme family protein [bacterium]